jgi:hypothetical protein
LAFETAGEAGKSRSLAAKRTHRIKAAFVRWFMETAGDRIERSSPNI